MAQPSDLRMGSHCRPLTLFHCPTCVHQVPGESCHLSHSPCCRSCVSQMRPLCCVRKAGKSMAPCQRSVRQCGAYVELTRVVPTQQGTHSQIPLGSFDEQRLSGKIFFVAMTGLCWNGFCTAILDRAGTQMRHIMSRLLERSGGIRSVFRSSDYSCKAPIETARGRT